VERIELNKLELIGVRNAMAQRQEIRRQIAAAGAQLAELERDLLDGLNLPGGVSLNDLREEDGAIGYEAEESIVDADMGGTDGV